MTARLLRHLILAFVLAPALFLQAQSQPDPDRHDKYKDDAGAYCWNPESSGTQVKHRQQDPHAHQCSCHLMCRVGPDNSVIGDQEDSTCELYCTRTHCLCHVEEPCQMPGTP